MRARLRMQLHSDPESMPVIINPNAHSNVYDSPRDGGSQYVGKDEDWVDKERITRK